MNSSNAAPVSRRRPKGLLMHGMAWAGIGLCGAPAAWASHPADADVPQVQTASPTAPLSQRTPPPPPATTAEACKRYNKFNTRAQVVEVQTSACDTVVPELGGFRSWLADRGMGFQSVVLGGINSNILDHKQKPAYYGGQRPTTNSEVSALFTYDLGRLGMGGDAQLTIKGVWNTSNFFPSSRYGGISIFAINQRFAGGSVELNYGYFPAIHNFYGFILGGNSAAAAFGPTSNVVGSAGVTQLAPSPAFQVVLRNPGSMHWYNNFIVGRSTNPLGILEDNRQNPNGLRFTAPGDKLVFVDELGFRRNASPDAHALWVRTGAVVNNARYLPLDPTDMSTHRSRALYGAVTAQLTQPYGDSRGFYIDSKADYSPSNVALFTHDYSATAFMLGPFASRPQDMTSLSWSQAYFSEEARRANRAMGRPYATTTRTLALSYAMHVYRGVYWTSSISRTWNPSFTPVLAPALLVNESFHISF